VLTRIVCKVLKLHSSQIDEDTPLFEYGIDSILGLNLIKELNGQLHTAIPTTILFDYPTINQFADYLKQEHAVRFLNNEPQLAAEQQQRRQATSPTVETVNIKSLVTHVTGVGLASKVLLQEPGAIADMQLLQFEPAAPLTGEVLVEVKSFALNFGDLLCVKGLYPHMPTYPFTPGFEAAGFVKEIGLGVTSFQVGDEVLIIGGRSLGMHATHVTVASEQLLPKPRNLSFSEACAMPAVSMTVVEAYRRAGLRAGETVLIQSATGGTGLIAIQMALRTGAKIIATAGSESKLNYLRGLGISDVINYREQDFEEEVKRITFGNGVDVLINTLGGENIQKGINCLGKRGRYVELSMMGIKSANKIDLSKFTNNKILISLDINSLLMDDSTYARELWEECQLLINQEKIVPTISQIFDLQQFREAYYHLENRDNIGKIVVNITQSKPESKIHPINTVREVQQNSYAESDIAIIGISGQFGSTADLDDFWETLKAGNSVVEEVPTSRWDVNALYSTSREVKDKIYCKWGSFLRDIDKFDPRFFRITGVEAETMDPQQRLFLEHCWKALEDAAINPETLNGTKCGVFVGVGPGDYMHLSMKATTEPSAFWGNSSSILASRISYYLNLKGPAVAVDTACSSSLVAMDLGYKSLLLGETDLIISGGVTVFTTSEFYQQSCRAGMLSPNGRCYTFDKRANGFVPGEGIGVVVMKRLKDAERDGDRIYGVIKGILTNQDGTTSGITAPSAVSQKNLEIELYNKYNINPETITYVEAHGTGTSLGDPIEFQALAASFSHFTDKKQYCSLGSVKSNIGHTVMAAGVSGVLKVLLSLKYKQLPPTINFQECNPLIDLTNSPFKIQKTLTKWEAQDDLPRRAAVSSFGFSGTNAHIVIEEYRSPYPVNHFSGAAIIPLSARNADRLRELADNLKQYLERIPALNLHEIAYSLQAGRKAMDERLAIVAVDKATLTAALTAYSEGDTRTLLTGNTKKGESFLAMESGAAQAYINHALHNKELDALAKLWVNGAVIEWDLLYANYRPAKVSLPTYPFARERYWLNAVSTAVGTTVHTIPSKLKEDDGPLFYVPIWKRTQKLDAAILPVRSKHVLVTGSMNTDFTEGLKACLLHTVFAAISQPSLDVLPDGVTDIYLLQGLNNEALGIGEQERLAFRAIKRLLASYYRSKSLNITVFTSSTQQIIPTDKVSVVGSGIVGLAGSLAKEQPLWNVRVIDIEGNENITDLLKTPYHKDGTICGYRGGYYYERNFYPVNLTNNAKSRFKQEGTYVILGGAGGLGRTTTAHLIRQYNARVVWLGRSAPNEHISYLQDDVSWQGNRPLYVQCDVLDKDSTSHAYATIKAQYGAVHGLFHSAIVLNDMQLHGMSEQDFEGPFAVKSLGSHHFVETFKEEPLDFICFYSSAQSQWNAAGQGNYSAGCSYKDSYGHTISHQLKTPVYIINWGYWGEVGIVSTADYRRRMALMGVESISSTEGMQLLEAVLSHDIKQVICAKISAAIRSSLPMFSGDRLMSEEPESSIVELLPPPTVAYKPVAELEQPFEAICAKGLLQVFRELGLPTGQPVGIAEKYHRLFKVLTNFLVERGYLEEREEALAIPAPVQSGLFGFSVAQAIDELSAAHPSYAAHARLAKVCLESFSAILTGKIRATDVIFPGGNLDQVSGIYKGNYQSDYFNEVLAEVVLSSVAGVAGRLSTGQKVRILEVGAGTGGSSEVIFRKLWDYREQIEYVYTDVSRSFLLHAEAHYREQAPYLKTALLNIEEPAAGQGQPTGYYDVVIGANVVHATRNIRRTLNHLKPLLKKNGALLLNEIVVTNLFTTLTFGLLDGWWRYEDESLRLEGSPCLSASSWATVLAETGFDNTSFYPVATLGLPQHIIAATSNGLIEQPVVDIIDKDRRVTVEKPKEAIKHSETISLRSDKDWLTAQLLNIVVETIKIPQEELDVNENFMDYGFDSIVANSFIKNVNEALHISLTPSDIYNNNNIAELANYIHNNYGEKLSMLSTNIDVYNVNEILSEIEDATPNVPESVIYPLSEAQKGLWYIQEMDAANFIYNIPLAFSFTGLASKDQLAYAFQLVLHEYPILRAYFTINNETGELCQKINTVEQSLFIDYSEFNGEFDVRSAFSQLLRIPFNLKSDPLVRFHIRQDRANEKTFLLFLFHHIVFDGMSGGIFMRSFMENSRKLQKGGIVIPKEEDLAFFDLVVAERLYMESEKGSKSLTYWKQKLSGTLPVLSLPFDLLPPKLSVNRTGYEEIMIEQAVSDRIRLLSRKLNVSLSSLMLSIFTLLLHKITNEQDIITLMPVAIRPNKRYETSIGFYINMMIVRNRVSGDKTFNQLVNDVKQGVINGFDHIEYPFISLISALKLGSGDGKLPSFKTAYNFQNIYDNVLQLKNGLEDVEMMNDFFQESESEYAIEVYDLKKAISIRLKYDQSLFLPSTIALHLTFFNNLLTQVLEDYTKNICDYDILSTQMREQLLASCSELSSDYDGKETFIDLFEKYISENI
jgi:polyketide synthase PksL/polyketide synthase PksR